MIDPNDYWVNNPLITPVNKALMYDNDIDGAVSAERERIKQIIQDWFDYDGDTSQGSKNLMEWIDEGDDK